MSFIKRKFIFNGINQLQHREQKNPEQLKYFCCPFFNLCSEISNQ